MNRTKKITKILRQLAKQLPRQQYASRHAVVYEGKELLANGEKTINNQPIDPDEKYIQQIPLYQDKSHFRRLKRAFDSNGFEGVKKYVTPYLKEEFRDRFFTNLKTLI